MDLRILEQVLADQKEDITEVLKGDFVHRKEESLVDLKSPLAQVVIGVRRCGKSTLCYNILKKSKKKFAYVNFDDERLYKLTGNDLNDVLEILYKINGEFNILFIDEIQNIPEWYLFVNRLLRKGMHILLTGSNAKILSGELATHLTGRHNQIELYPFSFSEYCDYFKIDKTSVSTKSTAFRRASFDLYLKSGGFPELCLGLNSFTYINTLVKNIVETDIKRRYKIRYYSVLMNMAEHLMNIAPCALNYTELQKLFSLKSNHTAENYVDYFRNAYLFASVQKYSTKSKSRIVNEKLYPIDVALMNNRKNAMAGKNLGWRLEVIVCLELLRRAHSDFLDVYYYSDRSGEADFVICKENKVKEIYQVCYDLSSEKTKKREIKSLLHVAEKLSCSNLYIITDHEYENLHFDNYIINIRPCYDWCVL